MILFKIKNFIKEIKWFIQRGKRGYADCDVWSIDEWFERTVPSMIKQLKLTKHGHPYDSTEEEYDKELSDLIYYLTEMNEDTCSMENEYQEEMDKNLWSEEIKGDTIDKWTKRQIEIDKYRSDMKDKALNLFSKLYYSLWD